MRMLQYHKTTTQEIIALKHRVRSLMDHWAEDCRYKEAVLMNAIRRFLPSKYIIGTGCVVQQAERREDDHLPSTQLDLIIYDNESPILFKEGDFVIITPDSVRGVIEVKANLETAGVRPVIKKANEVGKFIHSGRRDQDQPFFNGIFSFDGFDELDQRLQQERFQRNYLLGNEDFVDDPHFNQFRVNHVALNKDWFLKLWIDDPQPHSLYKITDLSFSFFISNLIAMLSDNSVTKNNFLWFPIDKENNHVTDF